MIRQIVQRPPDPLLMVDHPKPTPAKTIVQFWHDLKHLPPDVEECVRSWMAWESHSFEHKIFDKDRAATFISDTLGVRYQKAFELCYHPAMQSDYFRLCYMFVEGGFYIDADDECVAEDIGWLADDGRLKLQPLCYDLASGTMVEPSMFLVAGASDPSWIFYFNNNPLIAGPRDPIIKYALDRATSVLELIRDDDLPEIQMATGPGNISKSIFDLFVNSRLDVESSLFVLGHWNSIAVSKWPLSYRQDARNWRLSNQKRF